ncbi:hypothetical protein [Roseomonas sp. WA12]
MSAGSGTTAPIRRTRAAYLLTAATLVAAASTPAMSQDVLGGRIVQGRAAQAGRAAAPAALLPGERVAARPGSYAELVFTDGTSIVLEAGADFTLTAPVTRDPTTQRFLVRGTSSRGRLRVNASDTTDVMVAVAGGTVRVVAASAVLEAGPEGSATLVGGGRLELRHANGREDAVRRPGFTVAFENGGPRRRTREEIAALVSPFAPVERGVLRSGGATRNQNEEEAPASGDLATIVGSGGLGALGTRNEGRSFGASGGGGGTGGGGTDGGGTGGGGTGGGGTGGGGTGGGGTGGGGTGGGGTGGGGTGGGGTGGGGTGGGGTGGGGTGGGGTGGGGTGGGGTSTGPRSAASLSLAQFALDPSRVGGSSISAPRPNSGTTVIGSGNSQVDPTSQDPDANLLGIATQQRFGTGRVRRFAGASSGAAGRTTRDDRGVVAVPAQGGNPAVRGVTGALFAPLATTTLSQAGGRPIYDATARVGIVNPNNFVPYDLTSAFNVVEVPRVSVADAGTPVARIYSTPFNPGTSANDYTASDGSLWPRTGVYVERRSDGVVQSFSGRSISDTVAFAAAVEDAITRTRAGVISGVIRAWEAPHYVATNGDSYIRYGVYRAETGTINGQLLTDAQFAAAVEAAIRYGGLNPLQDIRHIVYNGSALFEVGLHDQSVPQDTPTNPIPPPVVQPAPPGLAAGQVVRLFGDIGLIVYGGDQALPPIRTTEGGVDTDGISDSRNTNVDVTTALPRIFIIDKVTQSNEAIFRERGIESGERYFVIGGTPLAPVADGLPGLPAGRVTRFAISDGLNPTNAGVTTDGSRGFQTGLTIQDQFVAPGSPAQPTAFNRFNAFRPDETFVNRPTDPRGSPVYRGETLRGDTHLLVVAGAAGAPSPAMRADLEVSADGRSSGSVSVGGIRLHSGSLVLSGSTYGSARLDTARASLAIVSALGSLGTDETGTGAHIFPLANPAGAGTIGHFAIGEADVTLGAPGGPAQAGNTTTVSGPSTDIFGFTRLATNVGAPGGAGVPFGPLPVGGLQGFAAGTVESFSLGAGQTFAVATTGLGGVDIQPVGANELRATIALSPRAAGELPYDPQAGRAPVGRRADRIVAVGGAQPAGAAPRSAVVSPGTFAAVDPGRAGLVSVDSDLLRGIRHPDGRGAGPQPATATLPARDGLAPSNEHLAWGYFMGDLVNQSGGTQRDHVGLGFWTAGRPVSADTLATLTGGATYRGGMIGSVAEPGRLRTVAGAFTQRWDFGARSGSVTADFDNRTYGVSASMPQGTNVFTGTGATGDRTMAVQGGFFHNPAVGGPVGGAAHPAAVGGAFGVRGPGYGANGIFVGSRR